MRQVPLSILLLNALLASAQESYVVTPVDLNPAGQDYAPVLVDSTVVMCSLRERDGLVSYRSADTEDPFSDLYTFTWNGERASTPRLLSEALATPLNDGPAAFSMGGKTICLTRNQSSTKGRQTKEDDRLGLFFSALLDGAWSAPVPFDYNSNAYNVMHPAMSPDGRYLYFASDMPGGEGGTDLYFCELEPGGWSIPMNMGHEVNSESNELFPTIAANGKLYFSSNREGGRGKLDMYASPVSGRKWGRPEPLPEPMNSEGNDIGYTSFTTDRTGFFSSDRAGTDRIYHFRKVVPYFTECGEQQDNNYCYQFKEPGHVELADLPVHYRWNMGDGTFIEGQEAQHCYKGPGRYEVLLDLIDNASTETFFNLAEYELLIDDTHQPYITCADSLRSGTKEPIDALHTYLPGMVPEEYHWDFGDGESGSGRETRHNWSAPGAYTVKLAVLGTERSTGLVKARCVTKTVHVIKRFEDVLDLPVASSFQDAAGKTHDFDFQSLPFDQFSLSVQQNEDVRFSVELFASKDRISLDDPRFTEIRKFYPVYERYDPVRGTYTYSVGQAKDLTSMYEVFKKVLELKFMDAEVAVIHTEKVTDLSALALLNEQDLNNSVVRASTILFDNGKATFNKAFEPQLDKVLALLKEHPALDVVIEAHTDANGGDAFNFKLSQQRAQSILDYFVQGGAQGERLVPVGHGENHPIADNKSPDGRAQNRRVEFRLVMREDQAYDKH
jgi:outer membrane protein OmpA-like peptidoglycan-associated protein